MKKKTLFAALFLTLALVGCGEEEPVKTPEVLGTLEPSTQVTEESETETETETETEEPEEEFRVITEREYERKGSVYEFSYSSTENHARENKLCTIEVETVGGDLRVY